jgi:hypothetical protein
LNLAHLHLLLNHWPIIGAYIGVAMLILGVITHNRDIKQASFILFALIALVTIPAYLSGNAAAEVTKDMGLSALLVETHEGAAFLAFAFLELTGLFALIEMFRHTRNPDRPASRGLGKVGSAVLVFAIVAAVLMAVAGLTGGQIRHPEVMAPGEISPSIATIGVGVLQDVRYFVVEYSRWVWPFIEDLHFIGLIMILGTVCLLNIRVLGFLKKLPVGPLHRFIPLGIAGFALNVATGIPLFIGMPPFYVNNYVFHLKILAVLAAAGNLVLFHCTGVFRKWAKVGSGEDAPLFAKIVAAVSLILWIAVVVLGRYIPIGEV